MEGNYRAILEHLERTLLKCEVENWKLITVKRDSGVASRCPSLNPVQSTDAKWAQLKKIKDVKIIQITWDLKF